MTKLRAFLIGMLVVLCFGIGFGPDGGRVGVVLLQLSMVFAGGVLVAQLGSAASAYKLLSPLQQLVYELFTIVVLFVSRVCNNTLLTVLGGMMLGLLCGAAAGMFKRKVQDGPRNSDNSTPE